MDFKNPPLEQNIADNIIARFYRENEKAFKKIWDFNLNDCKNQSYKLWETAHSEYKKFERGCFLISYNNLEEAVKFADRVFIYIQENMTPDYEDGKKLIADYDPEEQFVVVIQIPITKQNSVFFSFAMPKDMNSNRQENESYIGQNSDIIDGSQAPSMMKEIISSSYDKFGACQNCGETNNLKRCRSILYCSRECQKQDWTCHKEQCDYIYKAKVHSNTNHL